MPTRSNYWSSSKFADWIRGTSKLQWGTFEEWDQWRDDSKNKHPIRYWIAEKGLDYLQDIIYWPLDKIRDLRYYINNRFITRSHALTAHPRDIKRGEWRDVGNRFLPCLFNELVDFVEVEQAWHYVLWNDEEKKKYAVPVSRRWFNIRGWRSPEAGLAYLDWASALKLDEGWGVYPGDKGYGETTCQAEAAKEIKELYIWWTKIYPARPDPYDASGWSAVCEEIRKDLGDSLFAEPKDPALKEKRTEASRLLNKIEEEYKKEEEEMLIRLIRIRESLWT
jgi:hypothetical protein